MIYCNLKGGLGNMMFQIAAAKSFAIENNTDFCFPNLGSHLEYLNNEKDYNPSLNHTNEYLQIFKDLKSCSLPNNVEVVQFPFHYLNINLPNEVLIDGFFQSEKYFNKHKNEIVSLFNFDFISEEFINEKYKFIYNNCTSIHIRRGDYVKYPNHHPIQTIEYYTKGVDMLKNNTDYFVVFSDDIEWCKDNFKFDNFIYIEDEKDYIELYLMSKCKNNIISNSSFSWWGAWLNQNEKIVIGPKNWFGCQINHNTDDILPNEWIKI